MKRESKVVPLNILKTYEVMELSLQTFLTSALDGNEQSSVCFRERAPRTKRLEGCVGSKASLDTLERDESLACA